jgi:hypothetical protein
VNAQPDHVRLARLADDVITALPLQPLDVVRFRDVKAVEAERAGGELRALQGEPDGNAGELLTDLFRVDESKQQRQRGTVHVVIGVSDDVEPIRLAIRLGGGSDPSEKGDQRRRAGKFQKIAAGQAG